MSQPSLRTAEDNGSSKRTSRIFRIENHDEALPVWRDFGGADRVLVHGDAHHDMWWVPSGQRITIANFITPALRDGLLREVYWIVPDRSWESLGNRRQNIHHLHRIQQDFPDRAGRLDAARGRISTSLLAGHTMRRAAVGSGRFAKKLPGAARSPFQRVYELWQAR